MSTRYPTLQEVVVLHGRLMLAEGQPRAPLIAVEKLESALQRPAAEAFGEEFYPALAEKAAVLLQGIVIAHPFMDGNKRAGLGAMLLLLRKNGVDVKADQDALYDFVIDVTTGKLRDVPEMAAHIHELFSLPG